MMERIERKMKKLLLASIGAAAVTREQSDSLLSELIEKGEEVIDRSGIRKITSGYDPASDDLYSGRRHSRT